jgi:SAM-dependent methyltransferase
MARAKDGHKTKQRSWRSRVNRRDMLHGFLLALCAAPGQRLFASESGNFSYIYSNDALREEFKKFLVNVFHLYPQDDLHQLINDAVKRGEGDEAIYKHVQARLGDIKPLLGDLTYSLPTLSKQKRVLADQTVALIDKDRRYDGYLELGSNGRFLDTLEEKLDIQGERFSMGDRAPTNSVIDIIDRGQFRKAGTFIPMHAYQPALAKTIPAKSVDLITVFIGFHHCPIPLRQQFLAQIREVLRPGGVVVVRDHNVTDERMRRMVALAHDVFNMGTQETWQYNSNELRNFYALSTLDSMMKEAGFKPAGRRLLQTGDPTLNTLMTFTRA